MTSDTVRRRVFRRIVTREAGAGANAAAVAAAAQRLFERLAGQLTPLIGDAGFALICARSLQLTQRDVPGLEPIRSLSHADAPPFARLQKSLEQQVPAAATESAVAVLVAATEVLESLVGSDLITCLLREAWPDDFPGGAAGEVLT